MSTLKAKQFHLIEDMDIAALTLAAVERIEVAAVTVKDVFSTWMQRSQERRKLSLMNDHLLDDIGLTRYDVQREVAKYFWQK